MFVVLLTVLCIVGADAACWDNKDCSSCSRDSEWWVSCRWCPLTNGCHAYGSWYNDCSSSQGVTSRRKCGLVAEPALSYNVMTAEAMAKWSSLAYITPGISDEATVQSVVGSEIGGNYRVIEFLLNDCSGINYEYRDCGAVIGLSDVDKHLVVAVRGTYENAQAVEQVLTSLTGMESFLTGGNVLKYNANAHSTLYSCVKSIVEERLAVDPSLRITLTGHSLGGAQASLIAAHLLADGVITQPKLELYTFGQPRVGDKDFAYEFDRIIGNSWRITSKRDPIVQSVPSTLFGVSFTYHTRREVFYDITDDLTTTSEYKICSGNEDASCIRDESVCLTSACADSHNNYFIPDVGSDMEDLMVTGTPPSESARDQCRTFVYSNP